MNTKFTPDEIEFLRMLVAERQKNIITNTLKRPHERTHEENLILEIQLKLNRMQNNGKL